MSSLTITLIGGPTALIEIDGFRLLTDPTFDAPGAYPLPHVTLEKLSGPALSAEAIGKVDAVLVNIGFNSSLGPIKNWGLEIEGGSIKVDAMMQTNRPGIFAAGDIAAFPGKLKLIATGFGEAATAVNQAVHWIYPNKKVAPGHSSNMAVFGQKDD